MKRWHTVHSVTEVTDHHQTEMGCHAVWRPGEIQILTAARRRTLRHDKHRCGLTGRQVKEKSSWSLLIPVMLSPASVGCVCQDPRSQLQSVTWMTICCLTRVPYLLDGKNVSQCSSTAQFRPYQQVLRVLRLLWLRFSRTILFRLLREPYWKLMRQSRRSKLKRHQGYAGYTQNTFTMPAECHEISYGTVQGGLGIRKFLMNGTRASLFQYAKTRNQGPTVRTTKWSPYYHSILLPYSKFQCKCVYCLNESCSIFDENK